MGLHQADDLIRIGAEYIDIVETRGGAIVKKVDQFKSNDIETMTGGALFEIAIWNQFYQKYMKETRDIGYTWIKLPCGTLAMRPKIRTDIINESLKLGFKVVSEIGRKHPEDVLTFEEALQLIVDDLKKGVMKILIRAEKNYDDYGFLDKKGNYLKEKLYYLNSKVANPDALIWEAPHTRQQQELIFHFGLNVNLENVAPGDSLLLEAMRQGLLGDKEKKAYLERRFWEDIAQT
jgi:phosphosulfolactate synthase